MSIVRPMKRRRVTIGSGRFDFGTHAPRAAALRRVKGPSLMALACCAYDAAMGIGVLNASSMGPGDG
jgi:hypothetical protein